MEQIDIRKYGDSTAVIIDTGEQYSYCELYKLQMQLAKRILGHSLVCIQADNDIGSLIGYLSCMLNERVSILLPVEINNEKLLVFIKQYTPDYLWMAVEQWKDSKKICAQDYDEEFSLLGYTLLHRRKKCMTTCHPNLALLLPTSGSTGNPKLVRLSRKNVITNTRSICQYLKLTETDRAILSLPISYTYGLSVVNTHLACGGSIVLTKAKVIQRRFWDYMKKYRVTFMAGVPYTYECLKKIGVDKMDLPDLRILTQAGGKLSEKQQKYWGEYAKRTGKEFFVMYGQTEATARISYLPAKDCRKKLGSVGIAVPDSKIMIEDEFGNIVTEPGRTGEVICIGDQVSMGYAECRKDLRLPDQNKGILHTGDIGYKDVDGYLYIVGRKNRFAKIYGKRIDLTYLEQLAKECFDNDVIALSDDKKIYLYTEAQVMAEQIEKLLKQVDFRVNIFEICGMEKLPRKKTGKIDYGG